MVQRFFILTILILAGASLPTLAQNSNAADASKKNSYDPRNDTDLSEGMLEMKQRWKIRSEEKEHQELLGRTDNAARLTDELSKSFQQNNQFLATDAAKFVELEKLVKKVRKSLGGDDDDETQNNPATLHAAVTRLAELGATLNGEVKENTRYEISASSIENANEMLEIIRFIRTAAKRP